MCAWNVTTFCLVATKQQGMALDAGQSVLNKKSEDPATVWQSFMIQSDACSSLAEERMTTDEPSSDII